MIAFLRARSSILVCVLLTAAVLAVYWPALNGDYVNFDDSLHVSHNSHVQAGLTPDSVRWAFTTLNTGNWHPLTWLSQMLDTEVYGLKPFGRHLTNVLLHLASALLLFAFLRRTTGFVWRSAFVAALFALHPLHVESVAWISERKDVLSAFFWMLTMLAYVSYVRRPTPGRYMLVVAAFVLGLMSKPMLVSLPFALLLLDYWPLHRFVQDSGEYLNSKSGWGLVREKVPLLLIAAVSCVVTVIAQQRSGAVSPLEWVPVGVRLANASVAYAAYVWKTVAPVNLAALYPHPHASLPAWQVTVSVLLFAGLSVLALRASRRRPYALMGWLWFVVTLVPVIGLLQVGAQAMADRYTYIPLIGLFAIVAWAVPEMLPKKTHLSAALAPLAIVVLVGLSYGARVQAGYWRNSVALMTHTVAVTRDNYAAENMLGVGFASDGDVASAIIHFRKAVRIAPTFVQARENLGTFLACQGKTQEAIGQFWILLAMQPKSGDAHLAFGNALAADGVLEEAARQYSEALRLKPELLMAKDNLRVVKEVLARAGPGRPRAMLVVPDVVREQFELGVQLADEGRLDESIEVLSRAVRITPEYAPPHEYLAITHFMKGDRETALKEIRLYEKYGGKPNPKFMKALKESKKD